MRDECRSAFWPLTEDCEGKVFCFYLDVLGLVTTAIGNLCHDVRVAVAMPFFRADGVLATEADIRAEHAFVKAQFCGMKGAEERATATKPAKVCPWRALGKSCFAHNGWTAAFAATRLRLTEDGVRQIVMAKMKAHDADLLLQYPAFEEWPWQAQLATHSMSWACGSRFGGGHPGGYPNLKRLLLAANFAASARECHINEAGNPGVIKRNVKNKALYLEAAGIDAPVFDVTTPRGVQGSLMRLGYDPGPIDGDAGPRTRAAVVAFQDATGLRPDGVVGRLTRAALLVALTSPQPPLSRA